MHTNVTVWKELHALFKTLDSFYTYATVKEQSEEIEIKCKIYTGQTTNKDIHFQITKFQYIDYKTSLQRWLDFEEKLNETLKMNNLIDSSTYSQ